MLKDALITQLTLTGVLVSFLYYLGVRSLDIYLSLYTIIYLASMLLAEPIPRKVRFIHNVISITLVAVFTYFAALRIMAILGVSL